MTSITHANRFSPVQPQLEIETQTPNHIITDDVIKRVALGAIICLTSFLIAPQAYAIRFSLTLSIMTLSRIFFDCMKGIDSGQNTRISPSLQPLTTPVHSESAIDSGPPAPRATTTPSNPHHRRRTPEQFQTIRRRLSRDEIARATSLPLPMETLDPDDLALRREESSLATHTEISESALPDTPPTTPAAASPVREVHGRSERASSL